MADETATDDGGGEQDDFDVPTESGLDQAGGRSTSTAAIGQQEQAPEQEQSAGEQLPEYLVRSLQREQLKIIPGETIDQAHTRYHTHMETKNRRFRQELKESREISARQIAELRQMMEPLAREHFQRARAAQTAELARQIPDRETDPEGYRTWLAEQTLIRDEERRQAEIRATQEWQQAQQQEAVRQELEQIDEYGYSLLAQSLGLAEGSQADPEVVEAYELLTEMGVNSARSYFPDASDEEIHEFVALSQQLDMRKAVQNGWNPADVLKARVAPIKSRYMHTASAPANGNGSGQAVKQQAGRVQGAPSPAAAQMQRESAAAAKRGPVSVPVVPRAGNGGAPLDPSMFEDEDDYVEAVLAGQLGSLEDRVRGQRKDR